MSSTIGGPPFSFSSSSSSSTTKFELNYLPVDWENPIVPVYRTTDLLPSKDYNDDLPPSYNPSQDYLPSPPYEDVKPAYYIKFNPETWGTIITSTSNGEHRVAQISFEDSSSKPSVTAEEVTGEETVKLESHVFFKSKGTTFSTLRGDFQWAKSSTSNIPFKSSSKLKPMELRLINSHLPDTSSSTSTSTSSFSPSKVKEKYQIVGRMSISNADTSTMVLEMNPSVISEPMFLGTVYALLKISDLKTAAKISVQGTNSGHNTGLPQNHMSLYSI